MSKLNDYPRFMQYFSFLQYFIFVLQLKAHNINMIFKCCASRPKSVNKVVDKDNQNESGPKLKTIARKSTDNDISSFNLGIQVKQSKKALDTQNSYRPRTPTKAIMKSELMLKEYVFPRSNTMK